MQVVVACPARFQQQCWCVLRRGSLQASDHGLDQAPSLPTAGGVAVVTFTPSSAVTSALKHGQKVNLTMGLTFTPAGGSANTLTRTLTLKPKKLSKTK